MSLTRTAIPYLTRVFGAARGCSMGCSYCSTARWSHRLACPKCRSREVHFHEERLEDPAREKSPQVVGVSFYDELFDPERPDHDVARVLAACHAAPQHIYVFLTKRPHRAATYSDAFRAHKNWWIATTTETHLALEARFPVLLAMPAAHRWLNVEPFGGSMELAPFLGRGKCEWVALGCESGRTYDHIEEEYCVAWFRLMLAECRAAAVPVFVKQVPVAGRCSHSPAEWPEDLRVQETPWKLRKTGTRQEGSAERGTRSEE